MEQTTQRTKRRLYGRRKGKALSQRKKDLMTQRLPQLRPPLEENKLTPELLNLPKETSFFLEIGFGGGEHLASLAEAFPETLCFGADIFMNGVASLLRHIDERNIKNIRIHDGDGFILLNAFPDHSLQRIYLLFPDPWPKKRHHVRRFLSQDMLSLFFKKLRPQGQLIMASDHPDMICWMQSQLRTFRHLSGNPEGEERPPPGWIETLTRYETKGLNEGRPSRYFQLIKQEIA